jgi:hypothetical protein
VICSGDLALSGSDAQFLTIGRFLARLAPTPVLVIPGNRDLPELAYRKIDPDGHTIFPAPRLDVMGMTNEDTVPDGARAHPARHPLWDSIRHELGSASPMPATERLGEPVRPESPIAFARAFGSCNPSIVTDRFCAVGINACRKFRSTSRAAAEQTFGAAAPNIPRIVAVHHPVLPAPGRFWRARNDMPRNAGDLLQFLGDMQVDLVCTGHLHRSHTGVVGLDGASMQVSMAPMLAMASHKKHRGYHLIEISGGPPRKVVVRPVRTETPDAARETDGPAGV